MAMFVNRNQVDDIEDNHKRLHLCAPGIGPNSSIYADFESASPLFNCSIDCSLGSFQGNISFDFNITSESPPSLCTCRGAGVCRFCLPVQASSSSFSVGPLSLRFSSTVRRRGSRGFSRDDKKFTVLRGVVKSPKFYRTTKVRKMNEALLFSLNRCSRPCPSSPLYVYPRGSRYDSGKYRSRIPISSAIAAMLNLDKDDTDADSLQDAVDEFNALNCGLSELTTVPEDNSVLSLTESLASTNLDNLQKNYEDDLCSRISEMPLMEPKLEAENGDLQAVNCLLQHLESFNMSSDVTPAL